MKPSWSMARSSSRKSAPEGASPAPIDLADVARRAALLSRLAMEFGYDPLLVTLSLEESSFTLAGESCAAEGRALADGRILVYYDPQMSNARMGCCLAHEIQHQKYFAVREAFRREPADGPLHRSFARFAPELLAERRGVSDYSNEHWRAWRGAALPVLFSDELAEGAAEPINETLSEIAKADYNFGPAAKIDPLWRELFDEVNAARQRLAPGTDARRVEGASWPGSSRPSTPGDCGSSKNDHGGEAPATLAIGVQFDGVDGRDEPGHDAREVESRGFVAEDERRRLPRFFSRVFRTCNVRSVAASPLASGSAAIEAILTALGLRVRAKFYGPHFCEIVASTSPKLITKPNDPRASGIALLLAGNYDPPTLVFEEINSRRKGFGAAMVDAVLSGLGASPAMFKRIRVDDASPRGADGRSFWERMAARHAGFDWAITQNERERAAALSESRASRPSPP